MFPTRCWEHNNMRFEPNQTKIQKYESRLQKTIIFSDLWNELNTNLRISLLSIYYLYLRKLRITRYPCLWRKTTLITGGVGGTGENPPSCKMSKVFLGSSALCVPIRRNGANLRSFKLWIQKFIFFHCLIWGHRILWAFL